MPTTTTIDLVRYLRVPVLRVRTGLRLAPAGVWGREVDEAAWLGVTAVDARQPILDALLPEQTHLGLGERTIIQALDAIAQGDFRSEYCLVYNLDLLLASLTSSARAGVWESLHSGFPHRAQALLLIMPATADNLLPNPDHLDLWRREGRLAE
jgi:hypothetical protein